MRLSLVFILSSLLFGCASSTKMDEQTQKKFLTNFPVINEMIAAKYYRNFKQYEGLTHAYWETLLDSVSNVRGEEFKKDLSAFDDVRVRAFEKGIVVCAYSNYFEIGFCDNTKCPGVEVSEGIHSEKSLVKELVGLLSYTCPKK